MLKGGGVMVKNLVQKGGKVKLNNVFPFLKLITSVGSSFVPSDHLLLKVALLAVSRVLPSAL